MSVTALALLVSAAVYTGFQWTIRIVVYPQFANVGPAEFVGYELAHQRRVTWAVGPLFAALVVSTGAVVVRPPASASVWTIAAAVVLLVVILGVTGLLAVPLHRRLSAQFDVGTHRRLLMADSVRVVAAAADTVVALVLLAT
jgi:hypothetical protein